MQTHSHKLWLRRLLALAPLVLFATGCVSGLVGDTDKCTDGKKNYAPGDEYTAEDGCNTCTCLADGTPSCTDESCDGGQGYPVVGCAWNGTFVPFGENVKDECGNPCVCGPNGKVECSGDACASDAGVPNPSDARVPEYCEYGKLIYKFGEIFPANDGCNTCNCEKTGISCTKKNCVPDGGPLPADASLPTCKYDGREVSGTFYGGSCNLCTCQADGQVSCNKNECGPGYCKHNGVDYVVGAAVMSPDSCGPCYCIADQKVWCDTSNCPVPGDAGVDPGAGGCQYDGKFQPVGAKFPAADGCNQCYCVKEGYAECTQNKCPDPTCRLGVDTFYVGQSVLCTDGCNTCTCGMTGSWISTDVACPALPPITACPANLDVGAFLAPVVYLSSEPADTAAIAVAESRCVSGQTRDFQLCYDGDFSTYALDLYVYATGTSRPCNAARPERVFSLLPLRDAYFAARPQEMVGKISLRSNGRNDTYGFTR